MLFAIGLLAELNHSLSRLQIFTLTVIGHNYQNTDHHKVPFALCFQRQHQNDILIQY